jgi:excisionase family DNA binding protein
MEDRFLTPAEVAIYLGVKISWVYDNWRKRGLRGVKIGQQLRFRRSDLDAWIEQRSEAA